MSVAVRGSKIAIAAGHGAYRMQSVGFLPLNRDQDFRTWSHFDPGVWIDMNPGFVRLSDDSAWAVFCRYSAHPEPGRGSIWAVRVDREMMPVGTPVPIVAEGIDPRVVVIDHRILLFYAFIERDEHGIINGSSVAFAEFTVEGGEWTCAGLLRFPKTPILGSLSAESQANWEKNWVPFTIDEIHIGLIYSHDPWDIIILNVEDRTQPKFESVIRGEPLLWDYGTIRGGTPPVVFDADHLVTFFHSAQTVGSRRIYSVGAVVFMARAPFTPVSLTHHPLLTGPYKSDARRFGWNLLASVVFPLGAERIASGYRLLCGRDDGEIGTFHIERSSLVARLEKTAETATGALHDFRGRCSLRVALKGLLYVPDPLPGIPDLPMIALLNMIAGVGRTFVDAGAHIGAYAMALAPGYRRVVAFEPSPVPAVWLERNRALNDYRHIACERVVPGDGTAMDPAVGTRSVAIDSFGWEDVDLLKIDAGNDGLKVLAGAERTIGTGRPVILISIDPAAQMELAHALFGLDYTAEPLLPLSPQFVLCLPRERRHDYDWFI